MPALSSEQFVPDFTIRTLRLSSESSRLGAYQGVRKWSIVISWSGRMVRVRDRRAEASTRPLRCWRMRAVEQVKAGAYPGDVAVTWGLRRKTVQGLLAAGGLQSGPQGRVDGQADS